MNPATTTDAARRLSAPERREQILTAALAVFGARGYVGATTDEVARAAGVSQPYVVRLFGSKETLFLEAMQFALDRLLGDFRAALAAREDDAGEELTSTKRVGKAYVGLLNVRGLHQTLSHSYLLGSHPVIGRAARAGFGRVWRFFRDEAGLDPQEARELMATGMLINTMIGLRLVDDFDSDTNVSELFHSCFPTELPEVLRVVPRGDEPW